MFHWITHEAWPVLRTTLYRWYEHDGFLLSAAMAYYAAFSLFPLCLVLISILGYFMRYWPQAQDQQSQMLSLVSQNVSPWLAEQLGTVLQGVSEQAGVGGPLGLLALLVWAIGVFAQMEAMFDRIWKSGGAPRRGWWGVIREALYDRFVAFLALLAAGAILVTLLVTNGVLSWLRPYVVELPAGDFAWQVGQFVLTLAVSSVVLGMIYRTFPDAPVRWSEALSGGLFTATILQVGQMLLLSVAIGEKYSAYGVVGSFIAIMLWFYYASAVLFLGAEFVWVICQRCPRPEKTS